MLVERPTWHFQSILKEKNPISQSMKLGINISHIDTVLIKKSLPLSHSFHMIFPNVHHFWSCPVKEGNEISRKLASQRDNSRSERSHSQPWSGQRQWSKCWWPFCSSGSFAIWFELHSERMGFWHWKGFWLEQHLSNSDSKQLTVALLSLLWHFNSPVFPISIHRIQMTTAQNFLLGFRQRSKNTKLATVELDHQEPTVPPTSYWVYK